VSGRFRLNPTAERPWARARCYQPHIAAGSDPSWLPAWAIFKAGWLTGPTSIRW